MHPQSPVLTIGGTALEKSDDLVILGVTFDSKMTFEEHLRSVSRADSQGIVSVIDRFLGDALGVLSCPFSSTVLQCGDQLLIHTLIKLLNRVVSGPSFLTGMCLSVTFQIVDL